MENGFSKNFGWKLGNCENKVSKCQLWIFFSNFFKFQFKNEKDWGSSKIKEIFFSTFKLIEKQLFPSSCLPLSRQTNDNLGDYLVLIFDNSGMLGNLGKSEVSFFFSLNFSLFWQKVLKIGLFFLEKRKVDFLHQNCQCFQAVF